MRASQCQDIRIVDIRACRRTLEKRRAARRERDRCLWSQARDDAAAIIAHIVAHYQPDRIIQWGSVLDADKFGSASDIDIAVDGDYDPETWFRLLGEVWTLARFGVDIVDLRHIEPEFADIIRMKGKIVYERDPRSD